VRPINADQVIASVGRRVGEIRSERSLTQAALAERLDLALQNLQRIEQGRQNLTLRTLASIANALGVEVRALLEPPTTPRPKRGRRPNGASAKRQQARKKSA
jgi:transcriptional regulator with XRE-family HTH domain